MASIDSRTPIFLFIQKFPIHPPLFETRRYMHFLQTPTLPPVFKSRFHVRWINALPTISRWEWESGVYEGKL
jgi:hypothetical protein